MKILKRNASDTEIKNIIIEWHELLAQGKYKEALSLLPFSTDELDWTPEILKKVINGYGVPDYDLDMKTQNSILKSHNVKEFVITSLLSRDDKDEIIKKMEIDRINLYGLDPNEYLGMVFFENVPLSGYRSHLTATFHIKKVGLDELTLEFLNIHVM